MLSFFFSLTEPDIPPAGTWSGGAFFEPYFALEIKLMPMVSKEQRQVLPEPLKIPGVGQGRVDEIEGAHGDVLAGQGPGYGGAGGVGDGDTRYLSGAYRGELGFAVSSLVDNLAYGIREGRAPDPFRTTLATSRRPVSSSPEASDSTMRRRAS